MISAPKSLKIETCQSRRERPCYFSPVPYPVSAMSPPRCAPLTSRSDVNVLPGIPTCLTSRVLGRIMRVHFMDYMAHSVSCLAIFREQQIHMYSLSALFPCYTVIIYLCTVKPAFRMLCRRW